MRTLRARRRSGAAWAVALILMAASPALAGHLRGVDMPDRIEVEGETLYLNGMGIREATFLKVDVYVAGLYLTRRTSAPEEILERDTTMRMHLVFLRRVERRDLTRAWIEGFEANNSEHDLSELAQRIERLNGWMSDLFSGDTLTFTYIPSAGTEVEVRGERIGVIAGDDFARALFAIWLGDEPPNYELKKGLLGEH